jgi:hypothetical protein
VIRVVMLGRLGNNLFQYALGRVLAEKHGVPLVMDASWFNPAGWREVKCLRELPGPAAGRATVVRRASLGARALLKMSGRHYWEYRGVPVLREPEQDQSFDPRFLDAPADCMLFGYFQSPRYFAGIADQLRAELALPEPAREGRRAEMAAGLRAPEAVAVHVRRGDYAGNPSLDLCGPGYYRAAMARLRESLDRPGFHIFSDDPAWCASRFTSDDVTILPYEPERSPLDDLQLMSLASHHIIANSSYSWWAAWLGKKPGQRVLMPHEWFRGVVAPISEKQCDGWETVAPESAETFP